MAAEEQQRERVVVVGCVLGCCLKRVLLFAPAPGGVAAEFVDQSARGGGEQPRARVLGHARFAATA